MTEFPGWPSFTDEEAERVASILRSNRVNYWTGTEGRSFEREFAAATDSRYAIALANGTVALDLAFRALNLGKGDDVIVTPRSFVASASSVALTGARPVFADVDPRSGNVTAESAAAVLTPETKAIVVVHLGGWPAELDELSAFAEAHDIALVEDCAQAHGARFRGRSVGSFGKISAWSFCQDKIITTGGEGGMLTTDDEALHRLMWEFKDHGKSFERVKEPGTGTFRWLVDTFGTNWRLTEMQAAIGRIQTARLPTWSATRRKNADLLLEGFAEISGLTTHRPDDHLLHAYYKLYAYVEPAALKADWSRDRIAAEVAAAGIPCGSGSCPEIYREVAFEQAGYAPPSRLPNARLLGETSLMFQVHPTLGPEHLERTVEVVRSVFLRAVR